MGFKPKTYQELMKDMLASVADKTAIEDINSGSVMKSLIESMEASMFGTPDQIAQQKLKRFLAKLGIKSAREAPPSFLGMGGVLQVEPLDAVMKNVTFDMKDLKLWKRPDDKS